jgi:hypothetical protein
MGSHPVNLGVRFLLEVCALVAMGHWGWTQYTGALRFVLAVGVPLAAALIWATFAVPDDPSRSGKAPVPVPGIVRLMLELAVFGFAAWALYDAGNALLSVVLIVVAIAHYGLSYDRIAWLLKQ